MKILGIGVDIIQNRRIRSLIKNKNFISRTFSKNEIKQIKEFNIGHFLIGESIFFGLENVIKNFNKILEKKKWKF